ncbi:hypothetical protein BDV95DRAFT_598351 [Massariosphaeria phaeospora]|uniref:Uncharacterized protein n=1 Tax=Massariosphaeria phaeospora TaxID=100035 RepID=A0A7C8M3M3_9PLEO|nr:hypothetical protein BDV95DRAFT_598351 [Massariosphaeria phaeospora]
MSMAQKANKGENKKPVVATTGPISSPDGDAMQEKKVRRGGTTGHIRETTEAIKRAPIHAANAETANEAVRERARGAQRLRQTGGGVANARQNAGSMRGGWEKKGL